MSSLPNFNPNNPHFRLLSIIFSIGVALGSGLGYGFGQVVSNHPKQQELTAPTQLPLVSLIKYERLQLGMTLTDVHAILGSNGTEVVRTSTDVTYDWENPDGSKISANFEGGKLISKKQSRLK